MATTVEKESRPFLRDPDPSPTDGCCSGCYRCIGAVLRRIYTYFKSYRHLLFALFGGQVLSCLLCGTGVTSQALEDFYGIAVPTTQLFLVYLVMAILFFPVLVMKRDFLDVLKENWWRYIILGLIDVEANYLVVLAYKYTTLTSIQLLDSFTIVTVLILSFVFLRVRYLIIHLMGVAMCLIGIISLVLADLSTTKEGNKGSNPLLGDLLCIFGSVLYAVSNVSQEYLVKNHSVLEWLGFIGFIGSFVSGIQLCFIERISLASVAWDSSSITNLIVFVVCLVLFYTLMPFVMKASGAVVVNLSLLTSDIFTLVFGIFLFKFHFSLLYILSFIIIIVGVFIFNLKPPPVAKPKVALKDLKTRFKEMKLRRSGSDHRAELVGSRVTRNLIGSHPPSDPSERRAMLVRGPLEAELSGRSYSTHYSQSMSYSYSPKRSTGGGATAKPAQPAQSKLELPSRKQQSSYKQRLMKDKESDRRTSKDNGHLLTVKNEANGVNGHYPGLHD